MKHRIILLLGLLLAAVPVFAQKPVSTIRFTTSELQPITVILNDRDFNRVGRSITFKDIPRKRHNVQIYEVVQDSRTGNKRGIKLYSGNIKLEPGKRYEAILDMKSRNLRVRPVREFAALRGGEHTNAGTQPAVQPSRSSSGLAPVPVQTIDDEITIPLSFEDNLGPKMKTLKAEMDKQTLDKDKIKAARNFTDKNAVSAYEARAVLSWLLFEDSKVELAQVLKDKVTDKENLDMLSDAFSFESNKTRFLDSLKK